MAPTQTRLITSCSSINSPLLHRLLLVLLPLLHLLLLLLLPLLLPLLLLAAAAMVLAQLVLLAVLAMVLLLQVLVLPHCTLPTNPEHHSIVSVIRHSGALLSSGRFLEIQCVLGAGSARAQSPLAHLHTICQSTTSRPRT